MRNAGKRLVVMAAIALNGCAMETMSENMEEDGVVENEITPAEDSVAPSGGPSCQPVLVYDDHGELTVKEWLCPVPTRPLPDPEQAQSPGMDEEWVTGSSRSPSGH